MRAVLTMLIVLGGCECRVETHTRATSEGAGEGSYVEPTREPAREKWEPIDIPPKLLPGGSSVPGMSTPGSGGWW